MQIHRVCSLEMFTMKLFLIIPSLVIFSGFVKTGCPNGWLSYLGSCYYFDDSIVTFQQAQDLCTLVGGYVVHVETAEEKDFLINYMLTNINESLTDPYSQGVWLGLTFTPDHIWKWLDDGSAAAFTSWYSTEPNGGDGEPCAVFHGDFVKYLWADVSCTRAFRTFCEKR